MVRLATDQRTRDYVDRRLAEGKTKTEAIRCLKRYIAREVFNALPREALVDSRSIPYWLSADSAQSRKKAKRARAASTASGSNTTRARPLRAAPATSSSPKRSGQSMTASKARPADRQKPTGGG